jgi:hypothetical protein
LPVGHEGRKEHPCGNAPPCADPEYRRPCHGKYLSEDEQELEAPQSRASL